jgi:hypothetical protein
MNEKKENHTPDLGDSPDFITELRELLNRHSMENGSDTPDFILAQYLTDCLRVWNHTIKRREDWYGRKLCASLPLLERGS